MNDINALQGQKHYNNNESVTLLPLQGVGIHSIITQGVALGYELFGPSARFNRTVRKIFVPNELLRTYKADANWSKYAICFESIEDCGIVLDECGIWMPETMDMMANSFENATPQILDTRLMNQTMFMTSSNHNIVSISGNDELMSFSHGEADVTVKVGNVSKSCHINVHEWPTIHVEQQGTLAEIIGENTYKYLRITGNINGDDINQLRYLCDANNLGNEGYFTSINSNPVLEYLDIK